MRSENLKGSDPSRVESNLCQRAIHNIRPLPDHPALHPDPAIGYPAGNVVAAMARGAGHNGIIYPSVRHAGGICIAALWPNVVQSVAQGAMHRLTWSGTPDYEAELL